MKTTFKLFFAIAACFLPGLLAAQNITVTGKVTDASTGEPLIGASVVVPGTSTGAVTDFDGNYTLSVPEKSTLQFSFIGYKSREVIAGKGGTVSVALEPDLDFLDEVVVIGYGSVRKKDLTGSVSQLTSDQVQKASVSNIISSLEGRIAGLSITPQSGVPGAGSDILIHGKQSINGSNSPIYVIDGTISDGLNISPNDVESVSILKDASAVAIYGARAANGVIVVTTKLGSRNSKPVISFKTEHSIQQEGNMRLHYVNAEQWVELATEAYNNAGKDTPWSSADLDHLKGIDVCWPDMMKQTGYLTTNNISVKGGSENFRYFISLNQTYNKGIIIGQNYRRLDLRINGDHKIGKRTTFAHSIDIFASGKRTPVEGNDGRDPYNASFRYAPLNPAFDENGEYATIYNTSLQSKTPNPVFVLNETEQTNDWKGAEGNISLSFDIIDGLKFTARASGKWQNEYMSKMLGGVSSKYGFEGSSVNKVSKSSSNYLHWILDYILDYNKTFKGGHTLTAMVGYSAEKQVSESLKGGRGGTPSNSIAYLDAGDPSTSSNNNSISEWAFISQFGRVTYSYKDKYYLNATVRRDGTSRLSGHRYGVFPSVSAAWRIGEENFMKSAEWLNELKLRASWGMVGNVLSVDTYGTSVYLSQKNAVLNETVTSGYTSANAVNTDLKWESTTKKGLGVDMTVLDNKLYMIADFYIEDTHNLLFQQPIPYSTGLSGSPYINAGHVRNTGFDVEFGYRQTFGDWHVDANLNFSHVKNEVIDLEGRDLTTSGIKEGYPIGCYYGYISDGINRTQEEVEKYPQFESKGLGDIRFKDINGDGKVDSNDRDVFGKVVPDFTYGLAATVGYKNFSLQIHLSGVQGLEKYMLEGGLATDMFNSEPNMEADYILDRFDPVKNPNSKYPRVAMGDPGRNQTKSDFWLIDASYLSIRNVSLSYAFPRKVCSSLGLGAMSVYVGAQNLYTIGNPYAFMKSIVTIPVPRVITCGFEFSF